jgi:hypothetical protein
MSAAPLETTPWPPEACLRQRRRHVRLLAAISDQLAALARGHALLRDHVDRLDPHTPDELAATIGGIVSTIVTPTDTVALLETTRPSDEIRLLLRRGFEQRTDALNRMRRLIERPLGLPSPPLDADHVRGVLDDVRTLVDRAGHNLAEADRLLIAELTPGTAATPQRSPA